MRALTLTLTVASVSYAFFFVCQDSSFFLLLVWVIVYTDSGTQILWCTVPYKPLPIIFMLWLHRQTHDTFSISFFLCNNKPRLIAINACIAFICSNGLNEQFTKTACYILILLGDVVVFAVVALVLLSILTIWLDCVWEWKSTDSMWQQVCSQWLMLIHHHARSVYVIIYSFCTSSNGNARA